VKSPPWTATRARGGGTDATEALQAALDEALACGGVRLLMDGAARTIAQALQGYGMVDVDYGGGAAIYAEGLWGHPGRSWAGLLDAHELVAIPFKHYRLLKLPPITRKGFDIKAAR